MMFTTPHLLAPLAGGKVDLSGLWDKFYGALTASTGFDKISLILGIVGLLVVLIALCKFFWDKRNGGGMGGRGGGGNLMWPIMVGLFLSAPSIVIPVFLQIIDIILNAVVTLMTRVT